MRDVRYKYKICIGKTILPIIEYIDKICYFNIGKICINRKK